MKIVDPEVMKSKNVTQGSSEYNFKVKIWLYVNIIRLSGSSIIWVLCLQWLALSLIYVDKPYLQTVRGFATSSTYPDLALVFLWPKLVKDSSYTAVWPEDRKKISQI
jgi:hypothetical protein